MDVEQVKYLDTANKWHSQGLNSGSHVQEFKFLNFSIYLILYLITGQVIVGMFQARTRAKEMEEAIAEQDKGKSKGTIKRTSKLVGLGKTQNSEQEICNWKVRQDQLVKDCEGQVRGCRDILLQQLGATDSSEQKTDTVHLEINGTGHVGQVTGGGEIRDRNSVRSYFIHLGKSK